MTVPTDDIHCYAIRRLSPFLGLWHIMQTPYGTAVTANGDVWQIQVLIEISRPGWGSLESHKKSKKYCLFGTWNHSQGLQRSPLNPMVDLNSALSQANKIIEHLRQRSTSVPFTLQDNFELWLLDKQTMQPVVLLASTNEEDKIYARNSYEWKAFDEEEQDMEYFKALLEHADIGFNQELLRAKLRQLIITRCGSTTVAQWVKRNCDGSGTGLEQIHAESSLRGRTLTIDAFPSLLISQEWDNDQDRKWVECYLQWISPALLNLPTLTDHERQILEPQAFQQPLECHKHASAYPRVLDQDALNSALVQAKIRLANQIT